MMYKQRILVVLAATTLLTISSCTAFRNSTNADAGASNTNLADTAQPEAGSGKATLNQDIRKVDFKNFTYEPDCAYDENKKITVKNAEYSYEKPADGYTDRFYFKVFEISYGDLNGDNSEEAVILTTCNTGGTGNFSEGFIYSLRDGKPVLYSKIPGGDRAEGGLRTARVDNGQLVVESNHPGETGGACCPEFILTTHYDASTGKLKPVGKIERRGVFPTERVKFAKGAIEATIKVKIAVDEGRRYIVGARAGQTLDVTVNNSKASVHLLEDAETTESTNGFSAALPKNGDYTIEVSNSDDKPVDIVLTIKIR
jgi:hypothetical protein